MTPSRTLLVTDIHGAYKALLQVLERAKFDPANDMLISLGDVCDCWPEVTKCVEFLSSLEHHKYVMGNHDDWCYKWLGDFLGERACGWMLDTGASYSGKLTVFDHGTHEFWQSDQVKKLYPKHKSR